MNRSFLALALALLPVGGCTPPAATADAGATVSAPADGGVRLLNPAEAIRAMDTRYDPLLRDAGVTGTVDLDLTLNADGTVRDSRVVETTHTRFSQNARQVAPMLRFTPPPADGAVVRVRMQFIYRQGAIRVLGMAAGPGSTR